MLGEAATTEEDAQRYYASYEQAIHAIDKAAGGRSIYDGPGISIKLLLAQLARRYDIGLNIDA